MLDERKRAEALAKWERLDGSTCPVCGADGRQFISLEETLLDESFSLSEGGWFAEWYRCGACGARIGVSRRFAPAGEVEARVEGLP